MSAVRIISALLVTFLVSSQVSSHHLTSLTSLTSLRRHRREDSRPASREVAPNVFSFTSTGLYISLFIITEDGVMVIDPDNVGHSRAMLAAIREKTRAPIRYLFYSHNHYDHLDTASLKTLRQQQEKEPVIVSGLGNAKLLKKQGYQNALELDWGEHTEVGPFTVHFVELSLIHI